jgi:hypothetical protein
MPDPSEIHRLDQLGAEIRETAHLVATYYGALKDEGLETEEALDLAARYQFSLIFTQAFGDEEDE